MSNTEGMAFLDLEADADGRKILDIGALREDRVYHSAMLPPLFDFLQGTKVLCGHNLFHYDLPLLRKISGKRWTGPVIDTLYLSPLLFPKKPYHALLKDDKLQSEELNNPVNDCEKARRLYLDEAAAFLALPEEIRKLYAGLLKDAPEFRGFFLRMGLREGPGDLPGQIRLLFREEICGHAPLESLVQSVPVEMAYALALIRWGSGDSLTPPWALRTYPRLSDVLRQLRAVPCGGCPYCDRRLNLRGGLRRLFGYPGFRTYQGEPLQERAAQAALDGDSLLAIFPTGGGKSITFQLPALLQGEAMHGLTVILSPLQSLMKDQVDHLDAAGITSAVTIHGGISAIERAEACQRLLDGRANLLFIAPEQLRSRTIQTILRSRTVIRFVIDEAHCFSAWGQEFRVDYMYIGDFIRELQESRRTDIPIAVSCFTATAKQKVIRDIQDYFARKLNLHLTLFATEAERENLHYTVLFRETDQEKYNTLRQLLRDHDCPAIIYASRTKKTLELAERLRGDALEARAFNGKMNPAEKTENQEAFLRGDVRIMVATSAFGMGVDKKDVGLVIHYDISDSLENYVQEAGRAGRDPGIQAECYVLYNNQDLDKHFILLNQTKLSMGEIQQVWRAVKDLTRTRMDITCSPLEIARQAGWENTGSDMETRVKTAIAALEGAGYVKRGRNMPRIYASGIRASSMAEAAERVRKSPLFAGEEERSALRILQFLISRRSIAKAGNDEAESRVDYIADLLGLEKRAVIDTVHLLRREGILADTQDMSAWLLATDNQRKSEIILRRFLDLEQFLLDKTAGESRTFELRKLNEEAQDAGKGYCTVRALRTILYYWSIKGFVGKSENLEQDTVRLEWLTDETAMLRRITRRAHLSSFALEELYHLARRQKAAQPLKPDAPQSPSESLPVRFSLVGLYGKYMSSLVGGPAAEEAPEGEYTSPRQMSLAPEQAVTLRDLEDALLYLSKIGALRLDGGFLVLYNGMEIHRIEKDNRVRFKQSDYRLLDEFYQQKIQQIHIVGEYANMMVRDYEAAQAFVRDYFQMEYRKFIAKYFKGDREKEITRNITPEKHRELFGDLSPRQAEIIADAESRVIVVAAGPGSGKTWVLVRKLASLLQMEDVKHEQLLMLTFTRAAATEFKKRLKDLIGNAAHYVEIRTFHSYCFNLLGRTGNLAEAGSAVAAAVRMIESGDIEPGRVRKSVLVIDEAQDMDEHEYRLVRALMAQNDHLRVIAVGDDDQNIFSFRGASARYMRLLAQEPGARVYEMTENFRSLGAVVNMENAFARTMSERMKTLPLQAVRPEAGKVRVILHRGGPWHQSLVRQIKETFRGGSAAVLTGTNEEALQVFTLLLQSGIKARLIQNMDGFSLDTMLELRVFLRFLDQGLNGAPVIPKDLWKQAKTYTEERCQGSPALPLCRKLWRDFEETAAGLYRTDLRQFIQESREEDFAEDDRETITVSTIHKAKGREYDQVYLSLRDAEGQTQEDRRRIYVGISRAKEELYLHCPASGGLFALPEGTEVAEEAHREPDPAEVLMQLGHRDVVLDYFLSRESLLGRLRAGLPLQLSEEYLTVDQGGKQIRAAKLSRAYAERIEALQRKGYAFRRGSIRYIVAWKRQDHAEECWILLPDLLFSRGLLNCERSAAEMPV
ncbi:MAG: RecQ family ATP-dependent DNA helicase [Clostridia bacterium]|nr:RecQ family ATP-dependent DNA helicase [Clostridia bacterium]